MSVKRDPYPEHTKLKAVSAKTQFVHDFLTFCEENGATLYDCNTERYVAHADLLYKFVEIDRWKLEDEKRAMLDGLRKANS